MDSMVQSVAACWFLLGIATIPALAQVERIGGGPVEFRSADRPIPAPTLSAGDLTSSDPNTLFAAGSPAAADLLKKLDKELGRTGSSAPLDTDPGRRTGAPSAAETSSDTQAQTTFK